MFEAVSLGEEVAQFVYIAKNVKAEALDKSDWASRVSQKAVRASELICSKAARSACLSTIKNRTLARRRV
jgi:hypothetical protein